MNPAIAALCDFAERQDGQVTIPQADFAGIPRDVVQEALDVGIAEWVVPLRVLRVRGGARPRCPRLRAHWLLLDHVPAWERTPPNCAVVSHRSALVLYGLPGLPGTGYEFTVPTAPRLTVEETVCHVRRLAAHEWRDVDGLPVTTPARTLEDFAASPAYDADDLARIISRFLRHGLAAEDELAGALDAHLRSVGAAGSGAEWLRRLRNAAAR